MIDTRWLVTSDRGHSCDCDCRLKGRGWLPPLGVVEHFKPTNLTNRYPFPFSADNYRSPAVKRANSVVKIDKEVERFALVEILPEGDSRLKVFWVDLCGLTKPGDLRWIHDFFSSLKIQPHLNIMDTFSLRNRRVRFTDSIRKKQVIEESNPINTIICLLRYN